MRKPAHAQFPDTIWVPVIYYDYKTDLSTPNFEFGGQDPNCGNDINTGERGYVRSALDDDLKPILWDRSTLLGCIDRIDEWYRPSGRYGPDTTAEFVYDSTVMQWRWSNLVPYVPDSLQNDTIPDSLQYRPNEYVSRDFNPSYNMATIVIYDSLPFLHLYAQTKREDHYGMYQFSKLGGASEPSFNPIPDRGWGTTPGGVSPYDTVNYSFAMEIQMDFEYREGLNFSFNGDDDVFVFINKDLVLELGGPHTPVSDSFNLDAPYFKSDLGLVQGEDALFSFFYAERNATGSNIQITTNLIHDIDRLDVQAAGLEITAGNTINLNAELTDEYNNPVPPGDDSYDNLSWHIIAGGEPGDSIVGDTTGSRIQVTGTKAHRYYVVEAQWINPEDSTNVVRDTVYIPVAPSAPHHITIERDSVINTGTGNEWKPDLVERDTIFEDPSSLQLYAFVRDTFGNIIERGAINDPTAINNPQTADSASWTLGSLPWPMDSVSKSRYMQVSPLIDSVYIDSMDTMRMDTMRWVGRIQRLSGDSTLDTIIVSQPGLIPDTCFIFLTYVSNGPIITRAEYTSQLQAPDEGYDTLRVTFREPVVWPDEDNLVQIWHTVFSLYDFYDQRIDTTAFEDGGILVAPPFDSVGTQMTMLIPHAYGKAHFLPGADTLVLRVGGNPVFDTLGTEVLDTSMALIEAEPSWNAVIRQNPVSPLSPGPAYPSDKTPAIDTIIPGTPSTHYATSRTCLLENKGVHGFVYSTGKINKGHVVIYDPYGNLMIENLPIVLTDRGYMWAWDGYNQTGRLVASGTYLAIVTAEAVNGETSVIRLKVGIDHD
jgi:fibro-slime domain-containing protein